MSKEAIIDKILNDAQIKADNFVADAQEKADEILALAAEQCKAYLFNSQLETDKLCDDIEARSKTVAELDSKKLQLGAKTQILNSVFERALEKLKNLDAESYKALLVGMLECANDNDVIILSAREKNILTNEDVQKFATQKGIHLTLLDEVGNFDGGMIIRGNGIDKNLTFEVEVDMLRDSVETDIAKEMFG